MVSLVNFWFSNEHLWFNCSSDEDKKITQLFGNLVLNYQIIDLIKIDNPLYDILILDQISRHVDRVYSSNYAIKYQSYAIELSNKLIDEGLDKYDEKEICFILMPLRHSNNLYLLNKVLIIINNLREKDKNNSYLRRFYQATIRSLINLRFPIFNVNNKSLDNYQSLLCSSCSFNVLNQIDVESKLNNINVFPIVKSFIDFNLPDNVTISLSGGVDSMVSAFILSKLKINLKALMINYSNRETSNLEVEMVSSWCKRHSIPFYVRNIVEIKRTQDSDRDFYEQITKKIRFDSYKFLNCPVVLGHNYDDCLENIFSNIEKKRSYNNLFGMESISLIEDVKILRPMLKISKNIIIQFANYFNLPYLIDSTPDWSKRGQIRDKLIPSLRNFNPQIIPSIYIMAERFKSMSDSYHSIIESQIKLEKIDNGVRVRYIDCYDNEYWTTLIHKCFCYLNKSRPSYKSIVNLIENLKINKMGSLKVILTKEVYSQIDKNYINLVII